MHAELISIAAAFFAPILSATNDAVLGQRLSLVRLPSRIKSSSNGSKSAAASAFFAATRAMSEKLQWQTRRSFIPVLVVIHSSEVSRNVAKSSLLSMAGGTHFPQPVISAYFIPSLQLGADYNTINLIC